MALFDDFTDWSRMMGTVQAYLGFGGNVGNVAGQIEQAYQHLLNCEGIDDLIASRFYVTSPVYTARPAQSGNWFVNSVCSLSTSLSIPGLFQATREIEAFLGKVEKEKEEDRPIDIDLLFYGSQVHQDKFLEVPHPRWKSRLFVLIPLAELTDRITFDREGVVETYELADLIDPILAAGGQTVSPLEKNVHIQ